MRYRIIASENFTGTIKLPPSKSMMNRYLMLSKLSGAGLPENSSSNPQDISVFIDLLNSDESVLNAGEAGTVMRFSTALLSVFPGERILTGSGRLRERPIAPLVDALRKLGADISYTGTQGYPPLKINGRKLKGGKVKVPAGISSQFISALLMIGPMCEEGIEIETVGQVVSEPYIKMTISLMREMGVKVLPTENGYKTEAGKYTDKEIEIEKDWSSASFLYQLCALSKNSELKIHGLKPDSLQGDRKCVELFALLGVSSTFTDDGVIIRKHQSFNFDMDLSVDFTDIPDLVQPFVMTCMALNVRLNFSGLHNLHLKESNRLEALKYNIESLGGSFSFNGSEAELIPSATISLNRDLKVFNDHRMAMSLLPISIRCSSLIIPEIESVGKSFPGFWNVMLKLGFILNEMT